jgi:hypothetical protein
VEYIFIARCHFVHCPSLCALSFVVCGFTSILPSQKTSYSLNKRLTIFSSWCWQLPEQLCYICGVTVRSVRDQLKKYEAVVREEVLIGEEKLFDTIDTISQKVLNKIHRNGEMTNKHNK